MHALTVQGCLGGLVSRTVRPKDLKARDPEAALLVGFDTEWRVTDKVLLSVQFAARLSTGELVSRLFDAPGDRLNVNSFMQLLLSFLIVSAQPTGGRLTGVSARRSPEPTRPRGASSAEAARRASLRASRRRAS